MYSLINTCSEASTKLWGISQITTCSCLLIMMFPFKFSKVMKVSGSQWSVWPQTDDWYLICCRSSDIYLDHQVHMNSGTNQFPRERIPKVFIRYKQIWAYIWLPNLHQIQRSKNVQSFISMPSQFLHRIVFLQKCKITFILHPCQFTFCHNISDISKWRLCYLGYGKIHQHIVECG